MKNILNRSNLKIASLLLCLAGSMSIIVITVLTTTPKTIGPNGVTFWFIAVLIFLASLLAILLIGVKTHFGRGKEHLNKTINSSFRTAFLISLGLVAFLALRSLGTLGIKDVVLLGLVLVLIEFYLRTRSSDYDQVN